MITYEGEEGEEAEKMPLPPLFGAKMKKTAPLMGQGFAAPTRNFLSDAAASDDWGDDDDDDDVRVNPPPLQQLDQMNELRDRLEQLAEENPFQQQLQQHFPHLGKQQQLQQQQHQQQKVQNYNSPHGLQLRQKQSHFHRSQQQGQQPLVSHSRQPPQQPQPQQPQPPRPPRRRMVGSALFRGGHRRGITAAAAAGGAYGKQSGDGSSRKEPLPLLEEEMDSGNDFMGIEELDRLKGKLPPLPAAQGQDADFEGEEEEVEGVHGEEFLDFGTGPKNAIYSPKSCSHMKVPCRFVSDHPCCRFRMPMDLVAR